METRQLMAKYFVLFLLITNPGAWAYPQINEYSNIIPQAKLPTFLTPGQTYRITAGSTVILPCRITQTGYNLAWKRGIAVLAAGPTVISPDNRFRLIASPNIQSADKQIGMVPELSAGSYSLELRNVRPQDAGDYVCQLATIEPQEIVHTLEVSVPARIHAVSHTRTLEVVSGQMIKMECKASGNPVPSVTWSRKNDKMPSGESSVQGSTMVIQHADRRSAGQYECTADNGVGVPDRRYINVTVLYAPEVVVERATVHTGISLEAELVCIVYAEPSAQVIWAKDEIQFGTTERYSTHHFSKGNRYTLTIRNVSAADMGNYSCLASNAQGKGKGYIVLTGTATTAIFESPAQGIDKHKYCLAWSVNSHSSINEYRLYYRQQPKHHQHHHHQKEMNTATKRLNSTKIFAVRNSEWNTISINGPGATNRHFSGIVPVYPGVTKQSMNYTLLNLLPATAYEARVEAKNDHGWNKLSPIFNFTTRVNDMENFIEPSAQPAVYGSNQGQGGINRGTNQIRPMLFNCAAIGFSMYFIMAYY